MSNKPGRGANTRRKPVGASTEPAASARLELRGSNIVKLVGFPPEIVNELQLVLGGEDGRGVLPPKKYTDRNGQRTAELPLLGKPWTTDAGSISTDILLAVICGYLHKNLFYPITGLPPPRDSPPAHLVIKFERPLHIPPDTPKTQSVFAVSLPSPTLIRTVNVPADYEPLVVNEIVRLWGGQVKNYRSLADGCYEIQLKTRGLFSSNSSSDNQTPLNALIEYLRSKGFPLIHSLHFHSKSAWPDYFLFDCPDGPIREEADPAYIQQVAAADAHYYGDPPVVEEKRTKVVKQEVRGPPTVQPKKGLMGRGLDFIRGRRSSNPTPATAQIMTTTVADLRSRHSLDSKRDASSFYANGRAESHMTRRTSEPGPGVVKETTRTTLAQKIDRPPTIRSNEEWPAAAKGPGSVRSGAATPRTGNTHMTDWKSKSKSVEIEEERDVDANADPWGGFTGEPIEEPKEKKKKSKDKGKGKEKEVRSGQSSPKPGNEQMPGIHQAMDNGPGDGWGAEANNGWGDAANGASQPEGNDAAGWGWGDNAGEAAGESGGGGWGATEAHGESSGGAWGDAPLASPARSANGAPLPGSPGKVANGWGNGSAASPKHAEADVKSVKTANTVRSAASPSKALVPVPAEEAAVAPTPQQTSKAERKASNKDKGKSKPGKENKKTPNGDTPRSYDWNGPTPNSQPWTPGGATSQGGKGPPPPGRNVKTAQKPSKPSLFWVPPESARELDPHNGADDIGAIIEGRFVPAKRSPPAPAIAPAGGSGGFVPPPKFFSNHKDELFGPNEPTPEAVEKLLKAQEEQRKAEEEKRKAEEIKLEEARKHAEWARAVAAGLQADRDRQLWLQQHGISLVDYYGQHPEATLLGRAPPLPRAATAQRPGGQQYGKSGGKNRKQQDPYASTASAWAQATNGYSYEPPGGAGGYAEWPVAEGGYDYPGGEYGQTHAPPQHGGKSSKSKKNKNKHPGQDAYTWSGADQQWPGDQPVPTWAQDGPPQWGGAEAGPSNQQPGWPQPQKGGQPAGQKGGGKGKGKGKQGRNWRDEELDPYNPGEQGGWGTQGGEEAPGKSAGEWGWGTQPGGQGQGTGGGGWGNGGTQGVAAGKKIQKLLGKKGKQDNNGGWGDVNQQAQADTGGGAWNGGGGNELDGTWGYGGDKPKGGGIAGFFKSLFRSGKNKSQGGWETGGSGWNGGGVQVNTTQTEQTVVRDWGPSAAAAGGGKVGNEWGGGGGQATNDWGGAAATGGGGGWGDGNDAEGWGTPAANAWPQDTHGGHGAPYGGGGGTSMHRGQQGGTSMHRGGDGAGWGGSQAGGGAPGWPQPTNGHAGPPQANGHGPGGKGRPGQPANGHGAHAGPPASNYNYIPRSIHRGQGPPTNGFGRSPAPGAGAHLPPQGGGAWGDAAEDAKWGAAAAMQSFQHNPPGSHGGHGIAAAMQAFQQQHATQGGAHTRQPAEHYYQEYGQALQLSDEEGSYDEEEEEDHMGGMDGMNFGELFTKLESLQEQAQPRGRALRRQATGWGGK